VSCSKLRRVCGVQIDASRASAHPPSMVSSLLVEALSSPTDVLLSFYDTYDYEAINEFPKAVAKHFSDIFRTEEALSEVHSQFRLNLQADSQVTTLDTSSHPFTLAVIIPRSRSCPLPRLGPRHVSIARSLFVQVARWKVWRLGPVRSFPS
jgi:hypothetical protein